MKTSTYPIARTTSPSLRVAIVSETYTPEINGVAMTLGRLVGGLLKREHSVDLIRPRQHSGDMAREQPGFSEALMRGLPIPRYEGLRFGLPAKAFLMRRWQENRPDVVHVVTEGPLGWSAIAAAEALGLPLTSSFHTNFHRYSRHYGFGWLRGTIAGYLRGLHNRTHATLVPTASLKAELTQDGFDNLRVLARGVDTFLFNPRRRSNVLRHSWGVKGDDLVVLSVGRLAPEKNLRLVLRSFEQIHARRPDAKLVFVGDGPMRQSLQQKYPQAIFTGMRTSSDLAAHYASADLFLFPSLTETFGNVTTEALASGLGVVAYAHAAAADLIQHNKNGCLAMEGDEAAFIAAALCLATDAAKLQAIRAAASPSMSSLDWDHIHEGFIATLLEIAQHKGAKTNATHQLILAQD